jgi:hypothetical protein
MTRSGNPDFCEAMITKKVSFSLKEYELDDGYYSRGTLTIYGDIGPSGKPSTATVRLPEVK